MAKAGITIAISGSYNGRAIERARQDLEKLRITAAAEMGGATSSLVNFGAKAAELGGNLHNVGYKMSQVGDAATRGLTLPIVAAAAAVGKAAVDMDTSLTNVKKTVDGTDAQYQQLKESAIEFSKTNAVSASQIMDMQSLGAQLGFAIGELDEFGRVVSGLDIATNMSAEQAGTEMAQFANITKMAHSDIENYASAIVGLGNNMATTESDISAMAMRLAAAGTQVGMSQADVLGLAAAMSSMGVEAEMGGTAVSTIMARIDKDVATNSASLGTWAATAGTSAAEFADAWRRDPVKALASVLSGLDSATAAGGNMSVMLDELGISSLRQTDVMKRLAGNSDLVAQAVALSNEEWQKSTALQTEVDNRNASLAARIEILKNRVAAVAEQVGTPLVNALLEVLDAGQPLFDTVAGLAESFSKMSDEQQAAIVKAVALAAAFGPVTRVAGGLMSTFGNLAVSIGSGAQKLGMLSAEFGTIRNATSAAVGPTLTMGQAVTTLGSRGLPMVTAALGAVRTAMMGLGIGAALAAVGALAAALKGMVDHEMMVAQATTGLEESSNRAAEAYRNYSAGAGEATQSLASLKAETEDVLSSQAELARSMGEQWSEVGTNAATVDAYAREIAELTSKTDAYGNKLLLSREEMARLQAAVDGYNDATGQSVSIIDAANGVLDTSTQTILANAEAFKEQARAEAAMEMYKDLYKQRIEDEMQLKKVTEQLAEAQRNQTVTMADARMGVSQAEISITNLTKEQADLEAAMASADAEMENLTSIVSASRASFATLDAALGSVGLSMSDFGNLTEAQLAELRASFDGSLGSIEGKLAEFGYKLSDAGTGKAAVEYVGGVTDAVGAIVDTAASGAEDAARAATEALRKELDAQYKATQKAYDRQYKAVQRELDAEADAVKKAHDQQYKAQQKAFEQAESQLAKHHAARLKEVQKSMDAEYDARKKALDSSYDAVKKSLDSEVTAYRESSARKLEQAKKAHQAETDSFKKETDARVAYMNKEYQAQLNKLGYEEDDRTKGIDDRIAALEAEAEAEAEASKKQEQQLKITQLEKAMIFAESASARKNAEKELQDYIAEINREAREKQRSEQIDALKAEKEAIKQQYDERRAELQQSHDAQVESYKAARALQLEAVKEANALEETEMQESQQRQMEAMQAANEIKLEAIRLQNETELQNMRESQESRLETIREQQAVEQENMRENHAAQLEAMRESQSAELEALKQGHSDQLEALRESQSDQLEALREAHDNQLKEYEAMASSAGAAGADTGNALASGIDDTRPNVDQAVEATKRGIENALASTVPQSGYTGRQAGQELGRGLGSMVGEVVSNAGLLAQSADQGVSGAPGSLASQGSQAGSSFAAAIGNSSAWGEGASLGESARSGMASVDSWSAGADVAGRARSGMESLNAYNTGWNFSVGFANGVNGPDIFTAAWNVGIRALNAIRGALGIASPSKEAMKVGEFFGQGAIIGMRSTERGIADEAARMSQAMELNPSQYGSSGSSFTVPHLAQQQGGRQFVFNVTVNSTAGSAESASEIGRSIGSELYLEFARRERALA